MRTSSFRLALTFLSVLALLAGSPPSTAAEPEVEIKIIATGTGTQATPHSRVRVHYTGWLMDGTKFDSSRDGGKPYEFTLTTGAVIQGWHKGIEGMKVGGKRELIIPSELGYGAQGNRDVIPPNATLRFEVELVAVLPPLYTELDNAALQTLIDKGYTVVDVRTEQEWRKTGVIEGSKLLTAFQGGNFLQSFPSDLEKIVGKDDNLVLICAGGPRSTAVAEFLAGKAGYKNVYNVTEGINKWIGEGYPVVAAPR